MRGSFVALGVALGACAASMSHAQSDQRRPRASERIVHVFDFEEPDNPLPVPLHWVRGQNDPLLPRVRPGFPAWNGAHFSDVQAHRGSQAVYLPTQGGSTSLLLRSGTLPVLPGADYRVSAWIRTTRLEYARAVLAVRLLDEAGDVVPDSERQSQPATSEEEWSLIDAVISSGDAAYLQIELLLLQPSEFERTRFDFPELITHEDVRGGAWFDDVMVVQLPQTQMSTGTVGNIAWGEQRPKVHIDVRDMTGEGLHVIARLIAIDGTEIDRVAFPFQGGRNEFDWSPAIERYGWYRATVQITENGRVVGSDYLDLAWVPGPTAIVSEANADPSASGESSVAGGGSADRERFTLIVHNRDPAMLAMVPEATERIGVGTVVLPAWWNLRETDPSDQVDRMMPVVRALRENWQSVSLMFDRLPERVAADFGLDTSNVLDFFAADPVRYGPLLRPMLDRLGQMVRRWQIGGLGDENLVRRPDADALLSRIEAEIRRPVPEAELALPWPMEVQEPSGFLDRSGRSTVLHSEAPLDHDEVAALKELWTRGGADPMHERAMQVVLNLEDPGVIGYQAAAEAFARAAIEAWAAIGPAKNSVAQRGGGIAVVEPWVWTSHRHPRLMPRPEAAVLRNLIERMADRVATSDVALAPGVRCVLFEPRDGAAAGRGAALAVWAEPEFGSPEIFEALLSGDDLTGVDIFGNAWAIPREYVGPLQIPTHRVAIGSSPVFIEGVDAALIRFTHDLRLEPMIISSRSNGGEHKIVMSNPWPTPVRGEMYIVEPGGFSDPDGGIDRSWQINPRVIPFAMDVGEEKTFPVMVSFSPFEEAGPLAFVFDFDLTADREYGTIRIKRTAEIGAPGVRMRASYRLGPGAGGPHVYVDVDVTNVGTEPLTFRLMAQASGFPRDSASIAALDPTQSARRTFVFPDAAEKLAGLSVYVSLSVPDSDLRLNASVPIE